MGKQKMNVMDDYESNPAREEVYKTNASLRVES
ncbi:uncharacterized protein G2W53_011047 [Senna tora]|uniref:Uncharacterized protein n=1 Tax=Senna tora TaxID=362788 RepID=A0A834X269_9FABA|nr:uncharacterized protein G2W53_011047 [Senna tora]